MNEMPHDNNQLDTVPLPGAVDKASEYAKRILGGEAAETVLEGIGPNFRKAVEDKIKSSEAAKERIAFKDVEVSFENIAVPAQYEGMDAETVDFIWTVPEYVDAEKNTLEHERKRKVIEILKAKEAKAAAKDEAALSDAEAIEDTRQELGISKLSTAETALKDEYSTFKVSNGETDQGFYWYQYRNQKAKEMKQEGKFEWGKERIYFDVSIAECPVLRDIALKIAGDQKIAIGFKFMDDEKTFKVHKDGTETRFVANFASIDDAKKFYAALANDPGYQALQGDRKLDYKGIRLDSLAEYASGYREKRGALERIMTAQKNTTGSYEYLSEGGKKITLSEAEYDGFKKQYDEASQAYEKTKEYWKPQEHRE